MTEGYVLARYGTQETGAMSIIVEITIVAYDQVFRGRGCSPVG
jgi:hypothetical protein